MKRLLDNYDCYFILISSILNFLGLSGAAIIPFVIAAIRFYFIFKEKEKKKINDCISNGMIITFNGLSILNEFFIN